MMDRETLSQAIRRELHQLQLSQGMLAARLGVSAPTLRTWLHRNCYPRLSIKKLLQELKWNLSEEEVRERFQFDVARPTTGSRLYEASSLRSAFRTADRDRERIAQAMSPMVEAVEKLCAAMGERDLLITLSATVTPWEMERHVGREMREAVIKGIRNGGTYLYLRQCQQAVEIYKNDWKFDRLKPEAICNDEIESFRNMIYDDLAKEGMANSKAEDRAYRATPQYFVRGDLPFLVPGFLILMFRSGGYPGGKDGYPGGEEDRLAMRLPDNAWATVYLTKADYFHDRFRRSVCLALADETNRLNELEAKLKSGSNSQPGLTGVSSEAERNLARDKEILLEIRRLMEA